MSRPSLNGIVAFSMWRLKQRACLLLVACICLSEGVHAQQPSAAPNQQTLPQKPILGLMVTNPEGFNDNALPLNITNPLILGPYYPIFLWLSRSADKFSELEPPIQVRMTSAFSITFWEATVPYTEKSVGLFLGGSLRRPVLEHNDFNKNIALSYAAYKVANFLMPYYAEYWGDTMKNLKLEIDNDNVDPSTPVGIGNLAGLAVIRHFAQDGYNQLGDLTPDGGLVNGIFYNRWNYSDYTLFEPANNAYSLSDPTKWQPLVIEPVPPYSGGGATALTGAPYVQHHITPQIGNAQRLFYKGDVLSVYDLPPPLSSIDPTSAAYRAQVDEVLALSANLTEVQKLQAEHFDNKLRSLGSPIFSLILSNKILHLQDIFFTLLAADGGIVDANSEVWGQKVRFNAIRPISAIRYLYANQTVQAWGGPYRGTQTLTGNQYRSYIKTMQHADYPSGSACYCACWTSAVREVLGTDEFNFSITFPAGLSQIEPNKLPTAQTTLFWPTLTDYNDQCGWSRVLGGVHFRAATIEANKLCSPIGKASFMRARNLREGNDTGLIDITTVM